MAKPQKNQTFDLTIDNYSSEGDGIARLDGMAVFVKGALRGETLPGKAAEGGQDLPPGARVEQVVHPSPARIQAGLPPLSKVRRLCAAAHELCRGAGVPKRQRVEDALQPHRRPRPQSSDVIHGAEDAGVLPQQGVSFR